VKTPAATGRLDQSLVAKAAARRQRLSEWFEAIAFLDRTIEAVYHTNVGRLRITGPAHKVLAASFGKALNTLAQLAVPARHDNGDARSNSLAPQYAPRSRGAVAVEIADTAQPRPLRHVL
jgi:hypothetical protein